MTFKEKLAFQIGSSPAGLCVGIDPSFQAISTLGISFGETPEQILTHFSEDIIELTQHVAVAYKINTAFFEAFGKDGFSALENVINAIPDEKILLLDAKRGDIGNTAALYKQSLFDHFEADAITLSPLMGLDTFSPFLEDESKAIFSLALTSNPGSSHFLTQPMQNGRMLAEEIAFQLSELQSKSKASLGMVIGATQNNELSKKVCQQFPEALLLIPGIGAQGGTVNSLAPLLSLHPGKALINVSRSIAFTKISNDSWRSTVKQQADRFASEIDSLN